MKNLKKLTYEQFVETLQPYEIEGGFGVTLEKGYKMYYLPNDHPLLNKKFNYRNKRKAYQEYLELVKDKMATGGTIESFVLKHNDLSRKEMMSIGLSKGDLMKMAYGDNLRNVDSALPMGLLEELGISNDERYHYVMDYQNNSFGKLTDLFEKIEARNPKVEVFNTDYEELDVLPVLEAAKKYKNKEVFFQYKEQSNKMATGGGVEAKAPRWWNKQVRPYMYFVFNTETNKVWAGNEYENDAKDELKEFLLDNPKLPLKVLTKRAITNKKINPLDYNSWARSSEQSSAITKQMSKGGRIDLFEDYENIPPKVQAILDRYSEDFGGDGSDMDYKDTANMLEEVEAVGYTFGYGLDNEPYGLRPIGVKLNELRDYEDFDDEEMATGGSVGRLNGANYILSDKEKKNLTNSLIELKIPKNLINIPSSLPASSFYGFLFRVTLSNGEMFGIGFSSLSVQVNGSVGNNGNKPELFIEIAGKTKGEKKQAIKDSYYIELSSDFSTIKKMAKGGGVEDFDSEYWLQYNESGTGRFPVEFLRKSTDFENTFKKAIEIWNKDAEGEENKILAKEVPLIKNYAKKFFEKEKWISIAIIHIMIFQGVTEDNATTTTYDDEKEQEKSIENEISKRIMQDMFSDYQTEEEIADLIADDLGLIEGSIIFDNDYFEVKGVRTNGDRLEVSQRGEYTMFGGPYTPKMEQAQVLLNGENITKEVEKALQDHYGTPNKALDPNDIMLFRTDIWGYILDKISTSKATSTTTTATPTKNIEKGAAAIKVELSNGNITVYHSTSNKVLLSLKDVPDGCWDKLWDFLRNDLV